MMATPPSPEFEGQVMGAAPYPPEHKSQYCEARISLETAPLRGLIACTSTGRADNSQGGSRSFTLPLAGAATRTGRDRRRARQKATRLKGSIDNLFRHSKTTAARIVATIR